MHIGKMLPHDVNRHNSEYVRGEIHTQGIEPGRQKRGLIGTTTARRGLPAQTRGDEAATTRGT